MKSAPYKAQGPLRTLQLRQFTCCQPPRAIQTPHSAIVAASSTPNSDSELRKRDAAPGGRGGGRGGGRSGGGRAQRSGRGRGGVGMPAGSASSPPPPKYDMLVVVEGVNDMKAVRRAADADVYVLGTATRSGDPEVHEELRGLTADYRGVLLLLDPDVAGRQARNILTAALPEVWHAFVPAPVAVAAEAVGFKEAGNVGVEHAAPGTLRRVLSRRRRSEPGRKEFSREELQELGLIAVVQERSGKVTQRRSLVCDCLGLGACDGKQLLRQLNSYGFGRDDLSAALEWAEAQLQGDDGLK